MTTLQSVSYFSTSALQPLKTPHPGEYPGGPVDKTGQFHFLGLSSICGWGTKIPQAKQQQQNFMKANKKTPTPLCFSGAGSD